MKSWKTTLTGILTIIAALSSAGIEYLQHGTLPNFATLIPMLIAGFGLINAKDSNVSNAPRPVEAAKVIVPLVALLMIPVVLFSSCSTTPTGNAVIDRRNRVANALLQVAAKSIGTFAVNTLKNVVAEQMSGDRINFADAAAAGAWASASTVVNSSDVARVINAWSGNQLPTVAQAAAAEYEFAVSSGVPSSSAMSAIASTISATALQSK